MIFNGIDNFLHEKCIISGFVYSRNTKDFPESVNIQIGEIKTTDKNGFFSVILEPGTYDISVNFIGNNEKKLKNIETRKNNRLIIMFKLGTSVIY